jgi:ABC-type branched-subunit amino acid transport system substrate-binding protein
MGRLRIAAVVVCVVLVAAACGRSDDNTSPPSTASRQSSTGDFGALKNVCQPGKASGATAQGVTDDSIRVATFSDRGFAGRPGLNQELFDSGEVFSKWCNDAGGINGRKLVVDERDAALTEYRARIVDSCQQDFFMVGGGAVFDDTGVKDRLECMLPDVAGFVVTPVARGSDLLVQPLPNPPGALQIGDLRWFGQHFPESTKHVGILTGDLPTTVKVARDDREAIEHLGWTVVYSDKYPAAGAVSWTPYVQSLKDRGVRALMWTGEPEGLAKLEQAMADANYSVDWIRTPPNHNDKNLIDVAGAALKNTYVWSAFAPFEEAKNTPALQKYLDLFAKYAPEAKTKAYLGLQSWSAWLLFAQAARDCGSKLTRTCVYNTAKKIHDWTGGGLHARTDPGANKGSGCFLILRATPQGFQRVNVNPNEGIYNCSKKNAYFVKDGSNEGVKLADVGKTMQDLK